MMKIMIYVNDALSLIIIMIICLQGVYGYDEYN